MDEEQVDHPPEGGELDGRLVVLERFDEERPELGGGDGGAEAVEAQAAQREGPQLGPTII